MTPSPPPVTQEELEELERLARKATPGPWFVGVAYEPERGPVDAEYKSPGHYDNIGVISSTTGDTAVGCDEYHVFSDFDTAAYIAFAHPQRILSLLARLRGVTDVEGERGAAEGRPEAVGSRDGGSNNG